MKGLGFGYLHAALEPMTYRYKQKKLIVFPYACSDHDLPQGGSLGPLVH